jgi:hypothetical protein
MQGKNIQPTATIFDKEARLNEGFALRKNHGIEIPMAPPAAASAMYLTERKRIVVHERVCDSGSREERLVTMAAEMQPVTTSDQMSTEESAR